MPATVSGDDFSGAVDLRTVADGSPLPDGSWTVHAQIGVQGSSYPAAPCRGPGYRRALPHAQISSMPDPLGHVSPCAGATRGACSSRSVCSARLTELLRGWTTSREGTELLINAETDDRMTAAAILELVSEEGKVRSAPMEPSDCLLSDRLPLAGPPEGRWRARRTSAPDHAHADPGSGSTGPAPLRGVARSARRRRRRADQGKAGRASAPCRPRGADTACSQDSVPKMRSAAPFSRGTVSSVK